MNISFYIRLTILLVLFQWIPEKSFSLSDPWYWQGESIGIESSTQTALRSGMIAHVEEGGEYKDIFIKASVVKPTNDEEGNYYLTGWEFPLTEIQDHMHLKVGDEVGYFENGEIIWKTIRNFAIEPDDLNGGYVISPFLGNNPKPTYLVFVKSAFSGPDEYPISAKKKPCGDAKRDMAAFILAGQYAKGRLRGGNEFLTPNESSKIDDLKESFLDFGVKNWEMTSDGKYVFAQGPLPMADPPRSGVFIIDSKEAYFLENETINDTFYIKSALYFFDSGCVPDTDGCWSGIIDWEGYKKQHRSVPGNSVNKVKKSKKGAAAPPVATRN